VRCHGNLEAGEARYEIEKFLKFFLSNFKQILWRKVIYNKPFTIIS